MKTLAKFWVVALLVATSAFLWVKWERDEPRRKCVHVLQQFCEALNSSDPKAVLESVAIPQAINNQTATEQGQFLAKALQNEISPQGLQELRKHAAFGPLKEIFPNEATGWAQQAGAKPEDCVAFEMERAGVRAEVVLLVEGQGFRIVRCNNVKQMADGI